MKLTNLFYLILFFLLFSAYSVWAVECDTSLSVTPCNITANLQLVNHGTFNCNDVSGFGCVRIIYSNKQLDCNGSTIIGTGDSNNYGLYDNGASNITYKNCNLQGFYNGVMVLGNQKNITLLNLNISGSTYDGIWVGSASNVTIDNVNLSGSINSHGLYLSAQITNSQNNYSIVANSSFSNNHLSGIQLNGLYDNVKYARIYNNLIYNNVGEGIQQFACYNCSIYNNSLHDNGDAGISFSYGIPYNYSGANTLFYNNIIYNNAIQDIFFNNGTMNNKVYDNTYLGDYIYYRTRTAIMGNNFSVNESSIKNLKLDFGTAYPYTTSSYINFSYSGRKDFNVTNNTIQFNNPSQVLSLWNLSTGSRVFVSNLVNSQTLTLNSNENYEVDNCVVPTNNSDYLVNVSTNICSNSQINCSDSDGDGCIIPNAHNIVIDGQGSHIIGNFSASSLCIYSYLKTNVTIKNFICSNFTVGIALDGGNNSIVFNNTIYNSSKSIQSKKGNNVSIIYNTIKDYNASTAQVAGIYVYNTDATILNTGINVSYNFINHTYYGIWFNQNITNSRIENNIITNTDYQAIQTDLTSNNNIINNNTINWSGRNGIMVRSSYNNVTNNNIDYSYHHGLDSYNCNSDTGSAFNRYINNNVSHERESHLIYLCNSSNNYFENNILFNMTPIATLMHGIYIEGTLSSNNLFNKTTISQTESDCVNVIAGFNNSFYDSNISDCGRYDLKVTGLAQNVSFYNVFVQSLYNFTFGNQTNTTLSNVSATSIFISDIQSVPTNVSLYYLIYPFNDIYNVSGNSVLASNVDTWSGTINPGEEIVVSDWTNPNITINSPTNITYSSSNILIDFNGSDASNITNLFYNDGINNISYTAPVTIHFTTTGTKSFTFYVLDVNNNSVSQNVNFTIYKITPDDVQISDGCQTVKNNTFLAFGIIALITTVIAAFMIINIFQGGIGTGEMTTVIIGMIGLSIVLMIGFVVIYYVGQAIC